MVTRPASILAALLLFSTASAQIYQCEQDGAPVFSDRPCGEDARSYEPAAHVSYVVPDETLPALAESARAFIAERRSRLARLRRSALNPPEEQRTGRPAQTVIQTPWLNPHRAWHHRRHRYLSADAPDRPGSTRYSALNGPILGTRGRAPYRVTLSGGGDRERQR